MRKPVLATLLALLCSIPAVSQTAPAGASGQAAATPMGTLRELIPGHYVYADEDGLLVSEKALELPEG